MRFKTLLIIFSFFTLSLSVAAQTSAQIEAAKAMARSQGYSEAEINAMINQQQVGGAKQKTAVVNEIDRNALPATGFQSDMVPQQKLLLVNEPVTNKDMTKITVYGHDIFNSPDLNFIPSYNIPTPENYKLSAGDEIVIDLWGSVYINFTQSISPEGSVTIPELGPVYLAGQTIKQAEENIKIYLTRIYSGLGGNEPTTFLRVTLGRMRSFTINVVGDVLKPGTYTLPSLSNITSALYLAGGPNNLGSVRDIKLYRNNKLINTFDVYKFLEGDFSANVRLEDNDLIKVSTYENVITVSGSVKRPMKYELKPDENLNTLLNYAGGFSKDAYSERVHITRVKGLRSESFDITSKEYSSFKMMDGDVLTVSPNIKDNLNRVYIYGSVWHQGAYAISDNLNTLQQLINAAGGVKEDVFEDRGYIQRFNEKRDTVALHFSVKNVIEGTEEVFLMPDDSIRIFAHHELEKRTLVYTFGELNRPDTFVFRPGITLGDVILLSGGFTVGAARSNIDVARRNANDGAFSESDTIALVYNFNLNEKPEDVNFELNPYDVVFVRTAPNYKKQQTISVEGEVIFPGKYVIEKNVVRVSDVIKRAGGANGDAYIHGATIKRRLTDAEYERAIMARNIALKQSGIDSTRIEVINRNETYNVGLDLQAAIDNPGSFADVVLRTDDVINVPKMNNTVKISGGVLFKNTVTYNPSLKPKDYINMAGGYMKHAIRKNTYIVYMNGYVSRKGTSRYKVEPGCEIIVPMKDMSQTNRVSAAEIASIASSTASVSAVVISMINSLSSKSSGN